MAAVMAVLDNGLTEGIVETVIKKDTGLDDIVKNYDPVVDAATPIQTSGINVLHNLLVKYQILLRDQDILQQLRWMQDKPQRMPMMRERYLIDEILSPEEINAFVQATIPFEQHVNYAYATGLVCSTLIQNSYDHGHNDFVLATGTQLENLLESVTATYKNPLRIVIDGSVGWNFAAFSKYLQCTVTGNVGWNCAMSAQNSAFTFQRSVGGSCGGSLMISKVPARGCTFDIYGKITQPEDATAAEDCIFQFHDRNAAEEAWWMKPKNRVVYIDAAGKKEVME